ncbi:MAG: ATP-binding domain-containing protein [Ignavibacteria bacterium]|nr:ATP-binding domain-containing protein [Ignavibacteria bacterium]
MSKEESYSESRRLLYVALTRAKQYLYLTSYNPSLFFLPSLQTRQARRSRLTIDTNLTSEYKPYLL